MAERTQKGGWRINYRLAKNTREAICLPSSVSPELIRQFETLVCALVRCHRDGVRLSARDSLAIEKLPLDMRCKLSESGLIEPTAEESVPRLKAFLQDYKAFRKDQKDGTQKHDNRLCNYLVEYFGDVRLDTIKPSDAAKMKCWLMTERSGGRGRLEQTSANRAMTGIKAIFNHAIDCRYLKESPFSKVKGGSTENRSRQYYVSEGEISAVIDSVSSVELKGVLAFARFAGLRIPSEIQDLRFEAFDFSTNIFCVPQSGKTGFRKVPIFEELRSNLEALKAAAGDSPFLFSRMRNCKNLGEMVKKSMRQSRLQAWPKFFNNLRSSCITDKERLGWSRSVMDAVFGNSEAIRLSHYVQPMPDADYGRLGGVSMSGVVGGSSSAVESDDFPEFIRVGFRGFFGWVVNLSYRRFLRRLRSHREALPVVRRFMGAATISLSSFVSSVFLHQTSWNEFVKKVQSLLDELTGLGETLQKEWEKLPSEWAARDYY
ncbi:MAG: tyrosine-type recombinase/integrase [Thermoguttaceae bacterium]